MCEPMLSHRYHRISTLVSSSSFRSTVRHILGRNIMTTTTASARTALDETSTSGAFQRKESAWRNFVSNEEGAEFPAESGSYKFCSGFMI